MTQKDLYLKDIERHIEGVIKADDEEYILQEIEEYVITKEIEKLLTHFSQEYTQTNFNDSLWISGYFGSGKSHLIKMLSLMFENKEVSDKKCGDIFLEKIKYNIDLHSKLQKAIAFPTETILFNIAQKADGIGNTANIDPILAVFLKVFNEAQGYYAQSPAIAEVERHLVEEGLFDQFKAIFLAQTGKDWVSSRKHILLNRNLFAKAYAELKGISEEDAKKNFDELRNNYKLDIDSFVSLIQAYIKKQPKNFRLIFCVDEVGQFIADNVRLMLSLQTLVETLSVACKGQAFLFVTSQNDLNATVGDLNANQSNDFSRILGRFIQRFQLSSSNADEVIQKRLLDKNPVGYQKLNAIYEKEKNNLKTLFQFSDNSKQFSTYKDIHHFSITYPFIPYQFDLLQAAIKSLSEHNVFMGKNKSVGERSMISVIQQVAINNAHNDIGEISNFSQLFDGLRDDMQTLIQSEIYQAERSLHNPLAVAVLKALFLVKYVKGFQATLNNIAILLLPKFEVNLSDFHRSVQEALNLLENQTYIQRTVGDRYEYLTNQEKDIENEIKNMELEPTAQGDLLANYLYEEIIRDAKIKLESNNQPYEFGKKLDDHIIGREKDFYLHFISPLNMNLITLSNPAAISMGRPNDLIVLLPEDKRLYDDLRLIRKTEKYVHTTNSPSLEPSKQRILQDKMQQNQDRKRTLLNNLREHIGDSKMYLNGAEQTQIVSKDPKTKVTQGIQRLINTIYPKLGMLPTEFTEQHLKNIMLNQDGMLFQLTLHEIEIEVLSRIQRDRASHERTTIKNLIDNFSTRPYGWYQTATLCIIAKLYKRDKISLKQDGNTLEDNYALAALQRNNQYANTIIELEEEIQPIQIQKVKSFFHEYFNEPNLGNESKEVARLFKQRFEEEVKILSQIHNHRVRFKFLEKIEAPVNRVKAIAAKDYPYCFTALGQYEEDLLDDKENLLEPLKKFMNGSQKDIFENVLLYLERNHANFDYIKEEKLLRLKQIKGHDSPYKGNLMQEAKGLLDEIKQEITALQKTEREKAENVIQDIMANLRLFPDFSKLTEKEQQMVLKPFEMTLLEIVHEPFISNIQTKTTKATKDTYQNQLDLMTRLANPPKPIKEGDKAPDIAPVMPKITYVRKDSVKTAYKKPYLENEADVAAYLELLKTEYLRIIHEDKRISL